MKTTILIAKANEEVITKILPSVKFTDSTKNTSTFEIEEKKLTYLRNEVKLKGYNPYALLTVLNP